jgi:hypothetical protein
MPDKEFIHSTVDVSSTLLYALDSGLTVMTDESQPDPQPRTLSRTEAASSERGVFYLIHPEWIFSDFQTMVISGGYQAGKYFIQPRVNFTGITIYFGGERIDQGRRRFGDCVVSWHRDWLEVPGNVLRPAPPDVAKWYKRILKHLSSGIVVRAGVHRYYVSRGVLADPSAIECIPPFDFIPWGPEVLKRPSISDHSSPTTE